MSKKHFEKIALAIKAIDDKEQRQKTALALADVLRGCNPRFNRELFIFACGAENN